MGLTAVPPTRQRSAPRTYEEIVRDIYNDKRANFEQRELLLAVAYAVYVAARDEDVSPLREARRVLGREYGVIRYERLVRVDAPRYEAPTQAGDWGPSNAPSCEAPRLRPYRARARKVGEPDPTTPVPIRPTQVPLEIAEFVTAFEKQATATYAPPKDWRTEDGVCGAQSHLKVIEKDPRTGWVIPRWYCKRHKDHADRVAAQVREQNEAAPEPVPNAGGLLPCYFKADWEKVYRHYAGSRWEPPKYGICADDWPTPGEAFKAHRRLRMVRGNGEEIE